MVGRRGEPLEDYFMALINEVRSLFDANAKAECDSLSPTYVSRLIRGDCVAKMKQMPACCVDFALTDPPYVMNYRERGGRGISNDDNARWIFPAFSEVFRLLKNNSYCLSFYGYTGAEHFLSAWRACGFRLVGHFVWTKGYHSSGSFTQACHETAYLLAKGWPEKPQNPLRDVQPWKYTGNKLHPTQKSVEVLTPLIQAYSKPGGLVLDPFGGSGSTAVAARLCKRRFVLFEIDGNYFKAAKLRLSANRLE